MVATLAASLASSAAAAQMVGPPTATPPPQGPSPFVPAPAGAAAATPSHPAPDITTSPPAPHPEAGTPPVPLRPAPPPPLVVPEPKVADGAGPTDHQLVIGRWGIEARRVSSAEGAFALRPTTGCAAVAATGGSPSASRCDVPVNALVLRHWATPAFAWSAGLAFAFGGGRQGDMNLDTYAGAGPIVGLTLLLGQWKHLAIGASPELTWIFFKPASSAPLVTHLEVSGGLEAELHFGFISLPALSLSLRAGLHLELDRGDDASVWALGFAGPSSAWGLLNNLAVRYYL